jgi:hypothetical protein
LSRLVGVVLAGAVIVLVLVPVGTVLPSAWVALVRLVLPPLPDAVAPVPPPPPPPQPNNAAVKTSDIANLCLFAFNNVGIL